MASPALNMTLWHHWLAYPLLLFSLAAVPLLGLLSLWERRRRSRDLARLGSLGTLQAQVTPGGGGRLRGLCLLACLILAGIGMAGPQWGQDVEQALAPGRDLVVVLDCSRSMLAETPTRLERSRQALLDLAAALQKRGGHRVALVLCAGRSRLACPLTHDYDHFRDLLVHLDPAALDVQLAPLPGNASGTRLGQGIRTALDAQDVRFAGAQDVLLISDGDDPAQDGEWRTPATEAARQGVPVHTIGIGDPDTAHVIALPEGRLQYEGQEVRSRLEEEPLREIARISHGQYLSARTRTLPLGEFYLSTIATLPTHEESEDALPAYHPRYPWLLGPALALLVLAVGWPVGMSRLLRWPRRSAAVAGLALVLAAAGAASKQDPDASLRAGNEAFSRGDFETAAACYEQALLRSTDPAQAAFNLAAARYELALQSEGPSADLQEAEQMYRCCLQPDDPRRARALYGLGNCLLRRGAGRDRAVLQSAIRCYDQCLASKDLDAELAERVRHNRARAVLLALQQPPPAESPEDRQPADPSMNPPEQQPPLADNQAAAGADDRMGRPGTAAAQADAGQSVQQTDEPPPGQGNLPPIPDRADAPPLAADEAIRHLNQAAERIQDEHRQYQRSLGRPLPPGIRDW